MAVWPSIETASSMVEHEKKAQIRSDFEAGYVQSMPKWTRTRKIFELSWSMMVDTDKVILLSFFDTNQGGSFTWTHPVSAVTHTVRFSDDEIQARYVTGGYWKIDVKLEEL